MRNTLISILTIMLLPNLSSAQNVNYAQNVIDTLCSPYFDGRGYTNNGDIKASEYIKAQFEQIGIKPLINNSFYHNFSLNVNTFPGRVEVIKDNKVLPTGRDYIISTDFPSMETGVMEVVFASEEKLRSKREFKRILKSKWKKNKVLVIDTLSKDPLVQQRLIKILKKYKKAVHFEVVKKLTWGVSTKQSKQGVVYVLPGVLSDGNKISVQVDAVYKENYQARNVVGMVEGSEVPDSFIFLTGHYDHLGGMGSGTYIAGANDNASGIAMILNMAQYFKHHPPRYTVVFIGFAAEEAGLIGSYYFVREMSQFIDPKKIRFVVNMDLMGSGQEGIMAVNGAVFKKEYELLNSINEEHNYLLKTKKRGKAANSDHYFFSEAGIPAFFFYLMGPYHHYHDIDDTAENLRLEKQYYDGSFLLIRDFIQALMHQSE